MRDIKLVARELRLNVPCYNNNRRVIVTDITTKTGKNVMQASTYDLGDSLEDVYKRCSTAKIDAFNEVWEMYCNDKNSIGFHITSKNTFGFSVAWCSDNVLVYITPNTEYHVVLAG